jgi:hypothetical protein
MEPKFLPTTLLVAAAALGAGCANEPGLEGDGVELAEVFADLSAAQRARVPLVAGAFRRDGGEPVTALDGEPSGVGVRARVRCASAAGVRVTSATRPDAYVDVTPRSAATWTGCGRVHREGAFVAFDGAHGAGTTSLFVAGSRWFEEFVRVASPERMPRLRYRLSGGPGFGHWEADEEGGLWAYDADGAPLFHVPPPTVDDAAGVHVTGRWALSAEGGAWSAEAALPSEGLAFPLLIDPLFETPEWFRAATTNEPSARAGAAAVYHAPDGCVILHGGIDASGLVGDTRVRCAGAWQAGDVGGATRPSARAHAGLASVPTSTGGAASGVYLFGGVNAAGAAGDDEFWRLTLAGAAGAKVGSWQRIVRAGNQPWPRARYMPGMAWDGARLVLWGGVARDGTILGDTWAWNGAQWSELACTAATCFRPRYGFAHGQTGTSAAPTLYAFGGYQDDETPPRANGGGAYTDTLQRFADGAWSVVSVADAALPLAATGALDNAAPLAPAARGSAWLVRTQGGGLLLGSGTSPSGSLSDAWSWSSSGANRWERLPSPDPAAGGAPNPGQRIGATAVYDESMSETLLFGGMSGTAPGAPTTAGRTYRSRQHETTMNVTCVDSALDAGSTCNGALDKYTLVADVRLDGGLVVDVLRARGYFLRRKNGAWEEIPSLLGACGSAATPLSASVAGLFLRLSCQVSWDAGVDAFAVRSRDQAYYTGALCASNPGSTTVPYCDATTSYAGAAACASLPSNNGASATCN